MTITLNDINSLSPSPEIAQFGPDLRLMPSKKIH